MGGVVESLAFMPPNEYGTQEEMKRQHKDNIYYRNSKSGNKICLLYFVDNSSDGFTILYSHGNAEDLASSRYTYEELSKRLGCNLLAYDYSGYGLSTGNCKEKSCYKDIDCAFDFLVNDQNIPRNKIILFGRSLGSGPTIDIASRQRGLGGLILQSPLRSAVKTQMPDWVGFLVKKIDIFKNEDKLKNLNDYPIFIIHGLNDKVVPCEHGKHLFDELKKVNKNVTSFWVKGCGHNDIEYKRGHEFHQKLRHFIRVVRQFNTNTFSNNNNNNNYIAPQKKNGMDIEEHKE